VCCCGQPLFRSETNTTQVPGGLVLCSCQRGAVEAENDTSHGMRRTEVKCSRCDAHLGTSLMMDRNPPGCGIASTPSTRAG